MKVREKLVLHFASGLVVLLLLSTLTTSQSIEDLASDCSNCNTFSCNCTKVSVEGFSVSNVDSQSASLNWERRGITSVNGYAIIYEFDGKKKVDFVESRSITTKVLRDLRPFTNYTTWIRPRCEIGFALCTEVPLTFMTRGYRPGEAPQNVEVFKYEGRILVTWSPPPREAHNGPLTGYIITITNLGNATTTTYEVEGITTTSYILSSLSPGRYALRIRALNTFGPGPDTSSAIDFTIYAPDDRDGSGSVAIIGGVVGGVILLLMIIVMLCIMILCMRRSYKKKQVSLDEKVCYDFTDLNTDVKLDHNPSYVVATPDTVHYSTRDSSVSITNNPSYYTPITSNTSYNVPAKTYSEDEYNYVQPNECNHYSELDGSDTNPSHEVGEDRTAVFSTTKADHSSHDATSGEYDYAYVQDDRLIHHSTTANTTGDTKITESPYLTLLSNGANGSTAK